MQHILYLLKWQIRQHWIWILINLTILLVLSLAPILSLDPSDTSEIHFFGIDALKITLLIFITQSVHSQAYANNESFWMTRPIHPRALAGAQILLLAIFIALPALLGMLAQTYTLQGNSIHYLETIKAWGTFVGILYFVYAIAVATKNFIGFIILYGACALSYNLLLASIAHNESPLPDIYRGDIALIAPAFGLLALAATFLFIKRTPRIRIGLIGFSLLAPFTYSLLSYADLSSQPEMPTVTPPQFEVRPYPQASLDPRSSSFALNIQISDQPSDLLFYPYSFHITTNENNDYSRRIVHEDYDRLRGALIADRFITRFPPDTRCQSLSDLSLTQLDDISNLYSVTLSSEKQGNLWKQSKVKAFTLTDSAAAAQVDYSAHSLKYFDGLPLAPNHSITLAGTKIGILSISDSTETKKLSLSIKYAREPKIYYLAPDRRLFPALYSKSNQSLTLLEPTRYRGGKIAPAVLQHFPHELEIPQQLIASDSELYFILLKTIQNSKRTKAQAIAGTYRIADNQPE